MSRIGITGISGLLGWQLRVHLLARAGETEVVGADRSTFASASKLSEFVSGCDAVVHLAGLSRGDEETLTQTNATITQALIAAFQRTAVRPHVVFASSTHIRRDTAYGRSKIHTSRSLSTWASETGAQFTNLVLPNVFGEGGRPFHNSVVSTFCFQLANREAPEIIHDSVTEQVHAQRVAAEVLRIIQTKTTGDVSLSGRAISVSDLLATVSSMATTYDGNIIPDLDDEFNLDLFNTYRSYLYPKRYPMTPVLRADERGMLFEAVKSLGTGQTYVSITKPGVTRGNHFHLRKVERFLVLDGDAAIRVRRLFSDQIDEFIVSGSTPMYIDIPTFHPHCITNIGDRDLTTLFWSNGLFRPEEPDTYGHAV